MTSDCMVIRNKIREVVESTGTQTVNNISEDVAIALDKRVKELIKEGVKRAEANNRKTLYGRDI